MEKMINRRDVYEHIKVIEVLCKSAVLNGGSEEMLKKILDALDKETTAFLGKCYFESKETVDHLENMICDILDEPEKFGCSEAVYQIYVSILESLVEIKNDDSLRTSYNKKVAN